MSHTVRTIARLDVYHSVALCSHNAIHLSWGSASVHISQSNFVGLARLFEHIKLGHAGQDVANTVCRITQDFRGNIQLRLPELSLYFRSNDFLQFVSLIEEALLVLGHELPSAHPDLPTGPVFASTGAAWTSSRYRPSLN
jgi:hypothetical protein